MPLFLKLILYSILILDKPVVMPFLILPRLISDFTQSAEKQLKDSKKLIRLLESENTHLKMELETR